MKIFILEDSKFRSKRFRKQFKDDHIVICSSVFNAMLHLETNELDYDAMHLDHDLDGKILCSRKTWCTGLNFVTIAYDKIRAMKNLKLIVIHSWNPLGAYRMKKVLKSTGKKDIWRPCRWIWPW